MAQIDDGDVIDWQAHGFVSSRPIVAQRPREVAAEGAPATASALERHRDGAYISYARGLEALRGGPMVGSLYRLNVTSVAIVGLLLVILASGAASQPPTMPAPPLVIEGRVLWVDFGSQTMTLAPDNSLPITIDLRRIRQSYYHGFRGNEYVRVVGFILRPSNRIQAFELYLVSPWYPQEP